MLSLTLSLMLPLTLLASSAISWREESMAAAGSLVSLPLPLPMNTPFRASVGAWRSQNHRVINCTDLSPLSLVGKSLLTSRILEEPYFAFCLSPFVFYLLPAHYPKSLPLKSLL